jgi:hypothetical protein
VDAASLAALWAGVSAGVQATAVVPPPAPTATLFGQVASGKIGQARLAGAGVAAWGILPVGRDLLWLTLTDDRLSEDVNALTELALEGSWSSPKLLYQRIDLPWPFADRHWVLRLANNRSLAELTGAWERSWSVDEASLGSARSRTDTAQFDAATALEVNRGGWLLLPVDAGHTLGVYQAWTDLEGNIPAEAAESWARSSLAGLYAGLTRHSAAVRERYGAGCSPQPGGDGQPIPCMR